MIYGMNTAIMSGRRLGWAGLLGPVMALYLTVWGVHSGMLAVVVITFAASIAIPVVAADLLPIAMIYLGLHWLVYALATHPGGSQVWSVLRPVSVVFGGNAAQVILNAKTGVTKVVLVHPGADLVALAAAKASVAAQAAGHTPPAGLWTPLASLEVGAGLALLLAGAWLVPRTIGLHTGIMKRNGELASRVTRLTTTRVDAVDTAAAELRRVERDLHDGAQARLVALGISLRATERLIRTSPEAAIAMVAEARENSARALADLRGLVRGINPPVLAERGLGDAIEALALDTPIPAAVDIDLPGRPPAPVETAVYFAVAEILANAVKHADAHGVHIRLEHRGGMLRVEVSDDGTGGADARNGTGLSGVERRLGTFDGVLAISSPLGGPTIIAIEVPCALSSQKISSC
jgi:signal transduction histidine kinase